MNLFIISYDKKFISFLESKFKENLNAHIKSYSSFESFFNHRVSDSIDGLIVDTMLKDWLSNTIKIQNRFQNVKILFFGDDLNDCYKAYKVKHIGYLYKENLSYIDFFINEFKKEDKNQYISFYQNRNPVYLNVKNILYIEHFENKSIVNTVSGKKWHTYKHINDFEMECGSSFLRIHISYLINSDYIKIYSKEKVTLLDNTQITVSRKYATQFKEIFFKSKE